MHVSFQQQNLASHTRAPGKSHSSCSGVDWPQCWLPWWVRPRLGATPVWPALHRVVMPAQQEVALRRITHGPLWAPRPLLHPLAAGGGLCSFSPSSPCPGPQGTSVSPHKGDCAEGGRGGESQHCSGERQLELGVGTGMLCCRQELTSKGS